MVEIKLLGRLFLNFNVEAVTGLHIGGMAAALEIGGLDNPVVRTPLTQEPYIPGSSLRGKMRSQLEKKLGSDQNASVGKAKIHVCKNMEKENICPVCRLFGLSASEKGGTPTRLLIRDISLTDESRSQLAKAHTNQLYTELKAEVAIDRVTSMASPRNLERVPAGAVFGPAEMVFSFYEKEDINLLNVLQDCLQLVEDDYLGGGGSRGSGKVRFVNLQFTARSSENYSACKSVGEYENLQTLKEGYSNLKKNIIDVLNLKE